MRASKSWASSSIDRARCRLECRGLGRRNPLTCISEEGRRQCRSTLFEKEAKTEHSNQKFTPVWLAIAGNAMEGSLSGDSEMLKIAKLFAQHEPSLFSFKVHGYNLLHVAVAYDCTDLAELFLTKPYLEINARVESGSGETALHTASNSRLCSTIGTLLEDGADYAAVNENGMTPLHYAASSRAVNSLVFAGADIFVRDNNDRGPLEAAIARGARKAVKALFRSLDRQGLDYGIESELWDNLADVCEDVINLNHNISSAMARTLLAHDLPCCVNFRSERPESYLRETDQNFRNPIRPSTSGELDEWLSEAVLMACPPESERDYSEDFPEEDSERRLRETRIEEDEKREQRRVDDQGDFPDEVEDTDSDESFCLSDLSL